MFRTSILVFIVLLGLGYYANSWLNRADKSSRIAQGQSAPRPFQKDREAYIVDQRLETLRFQLEEQRQHDDLDEQRQHDDLDEQRQHDDLEEQRQHDDLEEQRQRDDLEKQRQRDDFAFDQARKIRELEAQMIRQQREAEFQARIIRNQESWMGRNLSYR